MKTPRRRSIAAGTALLAIAVGGVGIAVAGGDDGEEQATGPAADRARTAALAITGGGTANAVERDREAGATWEVEVTGPHGDTVDVRLDESYHLVVIEGDSEDADSSAEGDGEE